MKKCIELNSLHFRTIIENFDDIINLDLFLDKINTFKNEMNKKYSSHQLYFYVEKRFGYDDYSYYCVTCKRYETDIEEQHRENFDEKLKKEIKLKNLIQEMNELSTDDYQYVLEVLNKKV